MAEIGSAAEVGPARRVPKSESRAKPGQKEGALATFPGPSAAAHGEHDEGAATDVRKIFVLDTSVILHDHQVLDAFEEHDVAIPLTVLEELDRFKKGSSVLNRNAREFIRRLDAYSGEMILREWIPLNGPGSGRVRVILPPGSSDELLPGLALTENDHRILASARGLEAAAEHAGRPTILVSKDINLRLKARALNLRAEDYKRVQIRDIDHLYRGKTLLQVDDPALVDQLHGEGSIDWRDVLDEQPEPHHFFILSNPLRSGLAWYDPRTGRLERLVKESAYGVDPRNAEQTFALHAILDPDVPLVTLTGNAGTGKTLIALAGAIERSRYYRKILLGRPIVPLSNKDIGYLPGDVRSKIDPYMQPLWDNLSFIKGLYDQGDREYRRLDEMVEKEKLQIAPLAYIRGRSLSRVLFIVDEAQNLTPHEVKTIITRAGEGTKIVMTGDIYQIDTPYLDTRSNGLSFLIDRFKGQDCYAHVNLEKGERSMLANLASSLL